MPDRFSVENTVIPFVRGEIERFGESLPEDLELILFVVHENEVVSFESVVEMNGLVDQMLRASEDSGIDLDLRGVADWVNGQKEGRKFLGLCSSDPAGWTIISQVNLLNLPSIARLIGDHLTTALGAGVYDDLVDVAAEKFEVEVFEEDGAGDGLYPAMAGSLGVTINDIKELGQVNDRTARALMAGEMSWPNDLRIALMEVEYDLEVLTESIKEFVEELGFIPMLASTSELRAYLPSVPGRGGAAGPFIGTYRRAAFDARTDHSLIDERGPVDIVMIDAPQRGKKKRGRH